MKSSRVSIDSLFSSDVLLILPKERSGKLLAHGTIVKNPFRSEQQIEIPSSKGEPRSNSSESVNTLDSVDLKDYEEGLLGYKPTLVFKNIAPNMRWRRLFRNVVEWKVYMDPVM